MELDQQRRALVVMAEHRTVSARLPYLLHRAGLRVDVLGDLDPDVVRSRYVRRRTRCPAAAVVPALRARLAGPGPAYDWVIPNDETVLDALVRAAADEPWARAVLPVPAGDAARTVTSKARFTAACQQAGVRMPPSVVCRTAAEALAAGDAVGWPLIVKRDAGYAGLGVRRAADARELAAAVAAWPPGPWVVQRLVRGEVGSTQLLLDRGRPVCWFATVKRDFYPSAFSPSCVRQVAEHPGMAALVAAVGALTRFHGLGAIDWMVDDDRGELFLLELNPRPTPGFHLGGRAGVDVAAAVRAWVAGDRGHAQVRAGGRGRSSTCGRSTPGGACTRGGGRTCGACCRGSGAATCRGPSRGSSPGRRWSWSATWPAASAGGSAGSIPPPGPGADAVRRGPGDGVCGRRLAGRGRGGGAARVPLRGRVCRLGADVHDGWVAGVRGPGHRPEQLPAIAAPLYPPRSRVAGADGTETGCDGTCHVGC